VPGGAGVSACVFPVNISTILREPSDKLFVYGTLRPGSRNHYAERLAKKAHHIGPAIMSGRLYRVASYPGMVPPQSENDWVKGDLFEGVTPELLAQLDEYEGVGYSREIADAVLEDGTALAAYYYRYALPIGQLEWIRSGDWSNASHPHAT
jgi:gamma-glutamylcyclotransferase (GGCT)/AIG2-like uncharacterized protein YtfP